MFHKIFVGVAVACTLSSAHLNAQVAGTPKPYISVSGMAEAEVIPDEIYISIVLSEKYNGPNNATIEMQERQMKDMLKKQGVDLSNLSLSDVRASYQYVNHQNAEAVAKKSYSLKLSDAEIVGKVFRGLQDMDIKETYIYKVDNSGKEAIKRNLREMAIKDAKSKAEYMLKAIEHTAGMPEKIVVNEQGNNYYYNGMSAMKAADAGDVPAEFKKMKFSITVNADFEIR